ncbi:MULTISPECIES: protein DpdF [unclassified Microcoleus]|uniref:protein DpdF n=2 Tax=Microcoleus TaxID=44471 RepID=UPI001D61BA03|nr:MULTISPECIES: protein DpdF [unclassified Microcoleus]MCC3501840.1 ATP-dependent DNA helicase RecQ [Microcoleus sp. PH2017_19_SFW_U_A]MCC3522542.1 ATP-dependent DNA helicase RecQ [Microcoleus sp. PH2017_20_SFW_D_A]MCC3552353.1 ATP-dependent DNA helicase RecQ [Microcoleus sp. PH2017_35_SFW_U_B]TAG96993.1 MAG: ATP-dependent DNA helicase RecQ [Oscillatoriales cyanobacterium]
MADSFQELRDILQTGKIPANTSQFSEACYRRLLDALAAAGTPDAPEKGDIAALVRHVLRREDERQGGMPQTLKVPPTYPFPHREIWQQSGIDVLVEGSDYYLISARPWQPNWLDFSKQYAPDKPVFKEKNRRNYEEVVGDPFLELVDRKKYRSVGQREAIRAVLTAPERATLAINLPTGSGKSLCAQLPALLRSHIDGVSAIVVPTTALAIDQERALKPFVNHPTAYYGDESEEGQQKRQEIRDRLRNGTQRIVFTSPESLMNSLAPALYEAASLNKLRYFVIDEAHIVEQWGDDFRPAFQELPGLRRDLLRLTSFTTLLLTATLTESCLDTLETLFGKPGPFQVISAVQLRPEPSYWFAWCQSEEIRKQRLIEAVCNLPRPLIVYATKREDVRRWQQDLLRAGFKRCAMMTGESSTTERSQLIQDLRERRVDIVVATSAFGLGVDQSDVRAVIHACIPETIDRFYQEVGRGGRDGKAAISLALHTDEDLKIAKYLNEKSAITIERGLQRWESMFLKKEPSIDGRFRVLVNIPPSLQLADIDMNSEQNQAWNIRTLTLMSRASLIEMDADRPPLIKNFESKNAYQKAWELHRESRFIRILDESHLKKQTWEQKVEPIRQQSQNRSYKNLELMREALRPERCISEILAEAYTIGDRTIPEPRKQVIVSRACGGCPVCRKNRESIFSGIMPAPISVWQNPKLFVGKELERLLAGDNLMLIFYESMEEKSWKRKSPQVFQWLTEQGIKNLVVTREFYSTLIKEPNLISDAFIFLFEKYQPILMPRIPTLIFHPPGKAIPEKYLSPNRTSDAPLIIVLPVDTADPSRNDRKLIDIFPGKYFMFNHFCTEVNL